MSFNSVFSFPTYSPMQTADNGQLFTNEIEAYKKMLSLQRYQNKEITAVLVKSPSGKRGVFVLGYGANDKDAGSFSTSKDKIGTTLIISHNIIYIEKIIYKILGYIHTHPWADSEGYEGPSGVTHSTVNSARGALSNDLVAYNSLNKAPFFVIGPTQVSKMNPSKPFFNSYEKSPYNQHQIMTTVQLLSGKSLFDFVK